MDGKRILIVEDDPAIAKPLKIVLAEAGFEWTWVELISKAREALKSPIFSAIILDVKLPDGNGFDFYEEIRKKNDIPILILTSQKTEADQIRGAHLSPDDYVEKPFTTAGLVIKIKNIIKKRQELKRLEEPKSTASDSKFDLDEGKKIIKYKGKRLTLAPLEYKILRHLIMRPGRVFSRDEIISACWPDDPNIFDRTVDAHIKKIRKAIKDIDPKINKFQIITTKSKQGFMLEE